MLREKTVANVLRPIFAVLMVFLFIYGTLTASVYFTLLNPKFWSERIFDKKVREEFRELVMTDEKIKDNPYVDDLEDMSDTLVNFVLDEMIQGVFEQDYEVNYDDFEEMFEDEIQPVLEKHGASKAEIKEAKNDLYDSFNKTLNEQIFPQMEETFGKSLYSSRISVMYQFFSAVGLILIFTVVLVLIHKNKFKPFRALGISMMIGQGLGTLGYFIIYGILVLGLRQFDPDGKTDEVFIDFFGNIMDVFLMLIFIVGATFVLGIVMTVVFGILTGAKNKSYAAKNPQGNMSQAAPVRTSQFYDEYARNIVNEPLQNNYQQYAQPVQPYVPQYQQPQYQQPQYAQPAQQTYTQPVEPVVSSQVPVQNQTMTDDLNATTYGVESSSSETTTGSKIMDWDDELE